MENEKIQIVETSPQMFITQAIDKGLSIEHLERLMDLQERWQKNQSKVAFLEAMNIFQTSVPVLEKKKQVKFNTTNYKYAPLGEIVETIKETLKLSQLSYRWEFKDTEGQIVCTCIVSHSAGHSESSTMSAGKDSSGNKNDIQSRGSTMTYLQRYTLISALGISTADEDNDAQTITSKREEPNKSESQSVKSESNEKVSFKEFDPSKETMTFGKFKDMTWDTVEKSYLEWLVKEGKTADVKSKAEATLKYQQNIASQTQNIDDFEGVFGKKDAPKEEKKIEDAQVISIDDTEKKNKAMLAIAKAQTKSTLDKIAKQASDYLDSGEITEATFKAIGECINKRTEDIKPKGKI